MPYLLVLSSAFNTTDHYTFTSTLHSVWNHWFTSYLTSRSYIQSSHLDHYPHHSPMLVESPQGSVLGPGPIVFNLSTSPLSSLINSSSHTNCHHLYADDNQLYIVLSPSSEVFRSAANNLSALFSDIASWMSSSHQTGAVAPVV
jgi:hypothetical protein